MLHHFDWLRLIPFLIVAGEAGPRLSITRIVESIVIAAVCGAVSVYAAQQVIETRLNSIEQSQQQLRAEIHEMRRDLYVPHEVTR